MLENPYRAPHSAVVDPAAPTELIPAERWRRLLTFVVDYFLINLIIASIEYALSLWLLPPGQVIVNRPAAYTLVMLFVSASIYYIPQEGLWGVTVGKVLTGTRVVDEHGNPPGWRKAIKRTVGRFIPFDALAVLLTARRRGFHDAWPNTYVVRRR